MLPFPARQILPAVQIPIPSVSVQNLPGLLPPGSVCLPSICPDCRHPSRPLPGVSRKQRYNTLDFPGKVVCHEIAGFFGFFRSKGNLSPLNSPGKGELHSPLYTPGQQGSSRPYWITQGQRCFPFGIPLTFRQWLSILNICLCLRSARTLKTGTEKRLQ